MLTGGEPLLQVTPELMQALHEAGWHVAIETNGTVENGKVLRMADWVAVSPKRGTKLVVDGAQELKVVLPGAATFENGWTDEELVALRTAGFWQNLFIQPQDILLAPHLVAVTALVHDGSHNEDDAATAVDRYQTVLHRCLSFVMEHPEWRLSVQQNKILGLP